MFWICLVSQCIFRVFIGLNYCKIANLGSRTYCNTFLAFLELPNNRPKMGPRTPYLLQKYFKNEKKSLTTITSITHLGIIKNHKNLTTHKQTMEIPKNAQLCCHILGPLFMGDLRNNKSCILRCGMDWKVKMVKHKARKATLQK